MTPTPSASSSSTPVGTVEVQKDAASHTWYIGHVADVVSPESLLISFEGDVWPREEFPVSRVRKPARQSEALLEKFNPQAGDEVELRVNATEHAPACWGTAVVKNIKHSFYFVSRHSAIAAVDGTGSSEAIVEKDMLRPPGTAESLGSTSLSQGIFKLPTTLTSWAHTPDAAGCFSHIEDQSGLIHIGAAKGNLRLLGDKKAIQRAHMLLEVHVKHQTQIQNFQDVREKRLKALENKRNRIEGTGYKHSAEVHIHPSFVARIIGKNGEAIKALEERYEVAIRIIEGDDDAKEKTVRIFGNSPESLEKARAEVEYVEEVVPIESPQMNSWVLGKGGRTIQNFKETAGLVYAKLDRDGQKLSVCGTKSAVEDAVAMFETHMIYFPVFHQMDEEMEKIISQLEEYGDWSARREWGWYHEKDNQDEYWTGSKGKGKAAKGGKNAKAATAAKANGRAGKASWEEEKRPRGGKGGYNSWEYEEWEEEEEKPRVRNSRWANEEETAGWEWEEHGWWEEEAAEKQSPKHKGKAAKGSKKGGKAANGKNGKADDAAKEDDNEESDSAPSAGRGAGRGAAGERGRGRGRRGGAAHTADKEAGSNDSADDEKPPRPAPGARLHRGKKGLRS